MEPLILLGGLAGIAYVINESRKEDASGGKGQENFESRVNIDPEMVLPKNYATAIPYTRKGAIAMKDDAHMTTLEHYGGQRDTYQSKTDVEYMGVVRPDQGNPTGNPVRTDFYESRIENPIRAANQKPWTEVRTGRGLGMGFNATPTGGFHQPNLHDIIQSGVKSTDELRREDNPKLSYSVAPKPGAHYIQTRPEGFTEIPKHRPDTAWEQGPERWNTTTGLEKGERINNPVSVVMKDQNRETTDPHGHYGPATAAAAGFQTYIRPVWEPLLTFFKLTATNYFGGGSAAASGAAQTNYDVWNSSKINVSRDENNKGYTPNGAGHYHYVAKDENDAKLGVRKADEDYTWARSTNPGRDNVPATKLESAGAMTVRPEIGQSAFMDRTDPTTTDHLKQNPYKVSFNPDHAH